MPQFKTKPGPETTRGPACVDPKIPAGHPALAGKNGLLPAALFGADGCRSESAPPEAAAWAGC